MNCAVPARITALLWAKTTLLASVFVIGLAACGPNKQAPAGASPPEQAADTVATPEKVPGDAESMQGMEGMDHQHTMTSEQMTELRQKIPLYKEASNESIMENMGRMPPDFWGLISSKDMQGNIGVLALGHGYTLGGNEQFENYAGPISKKYPTAVAPGMAMMKSSHIQSAVDELTGKHGVKTIVVMPMEPGDTSSLNGQWQYIFGLRKDAPYLTIPQVKTDAKIIFTKSPAADPRVSTIMRDYAIAESAHPDKDRLVLVSHGPEDPKDNPAELALLQQHADRIRESSAFRDIKVLSVEDDAIPPVRAAHIEELRALIKEATDQGRDVVLVPLILTKGGFHARLQKDLTGLNYKFANKGLIEHPLFQDWINSTVTQAVASQ